MNDQEYLTLAEAALARIEAAADAISDNTDTDIDVERSGALLNLRLANGSQLIVNLQKPLHEIWLAAQAGGFHYRYSDDAWRCTKQGTELFADLSAHASRQAGVPLQF